MNLSVRFLPFFLASVCFAGLGFHCAYIALVRIFAVFVKTASEEAGNAWFLRNLNGARKKLKIYIVCA